MEAVSVLWRVLWEVLWGLWAAYGTVYGAFYERLCLWPMDTWWVLYGRSIARGVDRRCRLLWAVLWALLWAVDGGSGWRSYEPCMGLVWRLRAVYGPFGARPSMVFLSKTLHLGTAQLWERGL